MSTTTLTRTDTLPRVNLLPPEIAEAAKFRNAQAVMVAALVGAVAVVGGLTYLAMGDASSAQSQLDTATATNVQLQSQVNSYQNVPKVFSQVDAVSAQLTQAMGQEVRYSFVLKDLSLSMPAGVWLTDVTATQPMDGTTQTTGAWGTPAVATVTIAGQTNTLPQVAAWLTALARQKTYTDPFLTSAQSSTLIPGYQFSSSVALTSKAYSNRFTTQAGS